MKLEGVLVGAVGSNPHIQNMARALHEAGVLHEYATAGVDVFRHPLARTLRQSAGAAVPRLARELGRRTVVGVPANQVRSRWRWEMTRALASRLALDARLVDWLWEQSELDLDRACARLVRRPEVGGFLGVEHGALAALGAAKRLGKPAIVAFLSPHHSVLARFVDPEYSRFPELHDRRRVYFEQRTRIRDERRDAESELADIVVTNSTFTTASLVSAGFRREKMVTVPLGGPQPVDPDELPPRPPTVTRFLYAGPVSVRKGAHYLLGAWRQVARPGLELHIYGTMLLPDRLRREAESGPGGTSITFHGSVPPSELRGAYLRSSVLVLPTLCDGFGMVVSEALAHGLPVITTHNAGAADAVTHGTTGLIVPAADGPALTAALAWCADHPVDLFDMRRPALAAAGRWTWADFRRAFVERLSAALDRADHAAACVAPMQRGVAP
jgi:glycosyltransferase involved in cell wall biosynthesis